jgi:hypothetical protein
MLHQPRLCDSSSLCFEGGDLLRTRLLCRCHLRQLLLPLFFT